LHKRVLLMQAWDNFIEKKDENRVVSLSKRIKA